jgi:hypothetical protein
MREGGFSLIKPTTCRWNMVTTVISVLIGAETITFLLATLLHLGIPVPIGFTQPQIIPAAIVEGLCGIFLAVSAYAIFTHKTWAWRVALAAHVFAVAGVLLKISLKRLGTDHDHSQNLLSGSHAISMAAEERKGRVAAQLSVFRDV